MKDFDGLVLKILKNKEAKEHYILYYLMKKWPEICGSTIAKHSQPQRLENNVLFIGFGVLDTSFTHQCTGFKAR